MKNRFNLSISEQVSHSTFIKETSLIYLKKKEIRKERKNEEKRERK